MFEFLNFIVLNVRPQKSNEIKLSSVTKYLTHMPDTMDINIRDEQTTPSNNILERPTMRAYDAISFQVFSSYLFVRQYIKPSLPISVLPISCAAYHRNSECPFPIEAYNVCLHELPQKQYIQLCMFMRKFILVFDLISLMDFGLSSLLI